VRLAKIGRVGRSAALQNGETVDSLTGNRLSTLTKAQVYECLAYYEDHRGDVDLLVARQTADDQR
jgi:hypothetical protein